MPNRQGHLGKIGRISSAVCNTWIGQRGERAGGGVGSQGVVDLGAGVVAAEFEGAVDTHEDRLGGGPALAAVALAVLAQDHRRADLDVVPSSGAVYAMRSPRGNKQTQRWSTTVCEIDPAEGQIASTVEISGPQDVPSMFNALSTGRDGGVAFAASRLWGRTVHAFKTDGTALWTRKYKEAVNRVSVADIDGDGADEILVGTQEGLFAEHWNGTTKWHANFGNISNVSFMPSRGGTAPMIAADLSANLGILSTDGQLIREVYSYHGFMDLAAREDGSGHWEIIAIDGPALREIGTNGEHLWSVADKDPRIRTVQLSSMKLSPDGRWVAVVMKSGLLLVYDAENGMPVASLTAGSMRYSAIAWSKSAAGNIPLLIMAASGGLRCFELRPFDAAHAEPEPAVAAPTTR